MTLIFHVNECFTSMISCAVYLTRTWPLEYDLYFMVSSGEMSLYCPCMKLDICNYEITCMNYFYEFFSCLGACVHVFRLYLYCV
jgi:hypothetical protein